MKTKMIAIVAGIGILLAAAPIFAHHSFMAEYGGAAVTLKGKLIKFDWVNPHSWAYVEVSAADGKKVVWKGETPPINVLFRNGWTKNIVEDLVKSGEEVTLTGTPAKDGSNHLFAQRMTLMTSGATMDLSGAPPTEGATK